VIDQPEINRLQTVERAAVFFVRALDRFDKSSSADGSKAKLRSDRREAAQLKFVRIVRLACALAVSRAADHQQSLGSGS
jgi:hypothetical protein